MATEPRHISTRRLLRARDTMDRCYADALDIEWLANSVALSRAHFIRSFREAFGETPGRYLQRRRLERAMALLRETGLPITDICLDVGFTSLGTFSRTFREVIGESPREYRERTQAAPAATARAMVPGCIAMLWDRPSGASSTFGEATGDHRD
jgi:transcriptional regulator GlxA family with amidase domain